VGEQEALDVEAAGVAGQPPVGADHAVARHDHRDRVRAERTARRPHRLDVAGGHRDLAVGLQPAVRDAGRMLQHLAAERASHHRPVQRQIEVLAPALEVLLELPPHQIQPRRRLQHPRRHLLGDLAQRRVRVLAVEHHPHQSLVRRNDGQLADRRVEVRVGNIDQALGLRPRQQLRDPVLTHRGHPFRIVASPALTFCLAATSEQPIASPMVA
jgi:hypothetical protein